MRKIGMLAGRELSTATGVRAGHSGAEAAVTTMLTIDSAPEKPGALQAALRADEQGDGRRCQKIS